jgi:RNA polymerase sigma-70 factor, ECF subfamily
MTDKEIICSILEGSKENYRLLVEQNQDFVFRTCMGYVHNKEDADDLTQDVFLKAYQALPGFRYESSFSTWLIRIAINASLNKLRKGRGSLYSKALTHLSLSNNNSLTLNALSPEANPEEIIISEEQRKMIADSLDRLPDNQRTALVLSKYDDLPQKKIARIMDLSEGAVEALIQRAKAKLRKSLSDLNKKK